MPYITDIRKQADLSVALGAFSATCAANAAALGGLTAGQLLEIASMASAFATTLSAEATAIAAKDLATSNKSAQYAASRTTLAKWAKTFRANPAISDALLDQLNLPRHKTPGTKTPPTTPADLIATPDVQALVALRWKRNGNTKATQFVIEAQTSASGDWSIVGTTMKLKFGYQAELGMYVAFRVTATRDGLDSQPTLPVVLWPSGQPNQELVLAA